jgi:quercetin dioxygenase-like cupin family protein
VTFVRALSEMRTSPTACVFEGGADAGVEVSVFVTDTPPGQGPPLHAHPYPEVFVVQRGEATFTVGGEEERVGVGHVLVVPADTPHGFKNLGHQALHVVSIHPSGRVEQTWPGQEA